MRLAFLIGVIIFILFVVFCYFFLRRKFCQITRKYLGTSDIKSIMEQARIENEELPKSLSSMDSIYLDQIKRDFPDVNINELKRMCEKEIINYYRAIENKDTSGIKCEKVKAFVNSIIDDLGSDTVRYDDFKIHKTVVSKYENSVGVATIYFSTAFQYIHVINGEKKKVQDRVKCEYIYVIDAKKVEQSKKVLGLNCPNCGSPIISLGKKNCSYCGTQITDIISRVWIINDIVRY